MPSDTYTPGGTVPVEAVGVYQVQYRVVFQDMTSYGTPKGYTFYHDLGVTAKGYAVTELHAHKSNIRGRMAIWLESAPIGTEVWSKVLDA